MKTPIANSGRGLFFVGGGVLEGKVAVGWGFS